MATKEELQVELENQTLKAKILQQPRPRSVTFRVSNDTYQHLKHSAEFANMKISDFLNNIIVDEWVANSKKSCNEVKSLDLFDK